MRRKWHWLKTTLQCWWTESKLTVMRRRQLADFSKIYAGSYSCRMFLSWLQLPTRQPQPYFYQWRWCLLDLFSLSVKVAFFLGAPQPRLAIDESIQNGKYKKKQSDAVSKPNNSPHGPTPERAEWSLQETWEPSTALVLSSLETSSAVVLLVRIAIKRTDRRRPR